jgi:hypothetical protein
MMAKFELRTIESAPTAISVTTSEPGASMEPYVWNFNARPKQDPFFAVPSIVITAPRISLESDETKISITF